MQFCQPWVNLSWSDASSIATVIGAPIALWVYNKNARAVRLSHMHKLFTDYLRMAFDFSNSKEAPQSRAQLISFRMYSMEEMLLWIDKERWTISYIASPFVRLMRRPSYEDALRSWEQTIVSHLSSRMEERGDPQSVETARNLLKYGPCYTERFQQFCLAIPEIEREYQILRRQSLDAPLVLA